MHKAERGRFAMAKAGQHRRISSQFPIQWGAGQTDNDTPE
jgi:hypothetical protein